MFKGPGPTMNEVDTQFSILIAHYLVKVVILNFPPFFFAIFLKKFGSVKNSKYFFPPNRENSHRPIFGERAKESGYCDVNRTDLGR